MIKLLEEIDELLTYLEDTAHGEEGNRITEMRYKILTELSNSHKHGVSGKQQIQWQAIESYVNRFSTSNEPFRQLLLKQAREWFEGEFVACASGAVGTVAEGREFNLAYCDRCIQMTNHKKGKCCKCDARKSSGGQP